ncbi:MAG TPA: acyltransferase [Dokdonella sp.]|uniref:acyltransferase family protein n=1 Tax=Dokdonella sp. TaxID=2291710 RepID=UPI002D803EE9|nr:acyltransferase [Dokdonella sp.]HET9032655.1 acyltransferase [Dokdonella sp.]
MKTRDNQGAPRLPLHIPSLDGMRALSIALVIFAHAASTRLAPAFLDRPAFTSLGNVGVRFFFIISGFLITTLLLRDIDRHGGIRIKTFYIRRALRILPAALVYIGVVWLFYLGGLIELNYHHLSETYANTAIPDLIHVLSFTANYQLDYNWYFNHQWSLSVEEQFYFLWPFALFFFGVRYGLRGVIATILIVPFVRLGMYLIDRPDLALSREFQAVCDSLAMGCLTAIAYNRLMENRIVQKLTRWPAIPIGGLCIAIGYGVAYLSRPLAYIAGQTLANIGIVLLLLHVISHPRDLAGRVLNTRPLIALGVLSYSLYLWQEPFLYFRGTSWFTAFPQNIVLAFAAACASYFLVERPFLALKDRFGKTPAKALAPPPSAEGSPPP